MGKKLYFEAEDGSIAFKSERKAWGVDTPAYVYDLWLPLLGIDAIGLYGVYCRLEREGEVKGLNVHKLARKCRVGTETINSLNDKLVAARFIRVEKPESWQKLAHFTTKIITLDAPKEVTPSDIEIFRPKRGAAWEYEPLSPWLIAELEAPAYLPSDAGVPSQVRDAYLPSDANIDPSLIEPSITTLRFQEKRRVGSAMKVPAKAVMGNSTSTVNEIREYRALEKYILKITKRSSLTESQRQRLSDKVRITSREGVTEHDSPIDLYDDDKQYQTFAEEKIIAMTNAANGKPNMKTLTDTLANYGGFHGWLAYQKQHQVVQERSEIFEKKAPVIAGGKKSNDQ